MCDVGEVTILNGMAVIFYIMLYYILVQHWTNVHYLAEKIDHHYITCCKQDHTAAMYDQNVNIL